MDPNTDTIDFMSLKEASADWFMSLYFRPIRCRVQVEDLGLEKEILAVRRDHVASQNRYLYVNKQLHRMPSGLR